MRLNGAVILRAWRLHGREELGDLGVDRGLTGRYIVFGGGGKKERSCEAST